MSLLTLLLSVQLAVLPVSATLVSTQAQSHSEVTRARRNSRAPSRQKLPFNHPYTQRQYNPLALLSRDDAPNVLSPYLISTAQSQASRTRLSDLQLPQRMGFNLQTNDVQTTSRLAGSFECANSSPETIVGKESTFLISFFVPDGQQIQQEVVDSVRLAATQWADRFQSTVDIRVCLSWKPLGGFTLGATTIPNLISGYTHPNLRDDSFYHPALAAALAGTDSISSKDFHIRMDINSQILWHFDRNSVAPKEKYDLSTVVLHELTHGLFFTGQIQVQQAGQAWFRNDTVGRFDEFLEVEDDIAVVENCNRTQMLNVVQSPNLRFYDQASNTKLGLYAPRTFLPGSSIYHFNNATVDEDCKANGISVVDCSDLMTAELPQGYTRRKVGINTLRVYEAMRSNADGPSGSTPCIVPVYVDSSDSSNNGAEDPTGFVLPSWGIAYVAVVGVVGILLVFGVIVNTIFSRT